jgi:hypothetical protein
LKNTLLLERPTGVYCFLLRWLRGGNYYGLTKLHRIADKNSGAGGARPIRCV